MSYKEFEDEVEQRNNTKVFVRDAKGRFAKVKPIKPLPVNMKPQVSKWSTEEEIETEDMFDEFRSIQVKMNPKKDCKDLFEKAHSLLIASGGMISKVLDKNTNKPYGYLVRIPGSTNENVVFMRFVKINPFNGNSYFQKTNAIVSTLMCGERWLEKREERGYALDDVPFEIYFNESNNFMVIDDSITCIRNNTPFIYVRGRYLNEVEREGYVLNPDMIYYICRFEQKAKNYYKEDGKNKYFVALPFT